MDPTLGHHFVIVTAPGVGGGPDIKVFSDSKHTGKIDVQLDELFAYSAGFTGGVRVAISDVNEDGVNELMLGPGPGGGPDVRLRTDTDMTGTLETTQTEFFAFDPSYTGGIFVGGFSI